MKRIITLIGIALWMAYWSPLSANHLVVNVKNAGQLSDLVKDMKCDSITISGNLNWSDFSFLKYDLLKLSYLDLSEVILSDNSLPNSAFQTKKTLREVILPKNLEIVGTYAFDKCVNLEKVVFPDGLKELRGFSFSECPLRGGVELPQTVTSIGASAFKLLQVTKITLPDSLKTIGASAFYGSKLSEIVFPDSLELIEEYAFAECTQLQQAVFSACIKTIKDFAFNGCYRLHSALFNSPVPPAIFNNTFNYTNIFYVPQGTAEAYRKASYWADKIFIDGGEVRKVTVSLKSAGTLGEEILKQVDYVSDVNELVISGPLNEDDFYQIQQRATNLIRIDMTEAIVEALPEECFRNRSLLDIKLPATLKQIARSTFYGCCSLNQIEIPEGVTVIGYGAFSNCYSIREVKLPATLVEIDIAAFFDCNSLEKIEIPDEVSEISSNAFNSCDELREVKFPANLKLISYGAFYKCKSLEKIVLPDGLSEIQYDAFRECSGLKEVSFPSSLTTLGRYAFAECTDLASVTLPESLTNCDVLFYGCINLKKVICLASVPPVLDSGLNIFNADKTDAELWVPFWSLDTYKLTEGWDIFPVILPLDYETDYIYVPGKLVIAEDVRFTNEPTVHVAKDGKLAVRGTDVLSMRKYIQSHVLNGNDENNWSYQKAVYTNLLSDSGAMRADSVEYQLDLNKSYWQFIALPFDVNIADIKLDNDAQYVIRYYDGETRAGGENSNWKDMPADGILQAGTGYIVQVSKPVRMTLKAVNNGNKNRLFSGSSLKQLLHEYPSEFAHNASWNFLGNPYPCYFDIKYLGCTAPITVWDSYNRTYTAVFAEDDDYILNPMQAFFIQKPVGTDEITFEAEGRQLDNTVRQRTAAVNDDSSSDRTVFNFSLSDGTYTDRTRVVVNPKKSMEYELVCDAAKFMSDNSMVPQLFTLDAEGRRYAINERPLGDGVVALGCYVGVTGMYTLSLVNVPQGVDEVMLIDKQTDCEIHLEQDSYTFTAEAGLYLNRFELRLKTDNATGTDACQNSSAVQVTSGNGEIMVKAHPGDELVVYGANGQLVARQFLTQSTTALPVMPGFYLVCIGKDTFKIMVNQ